MLSGRFIINYYDNFIIRCLSCDYKSEGYIP